MLFVPLVGPAKAAEASAWDQGTHSAMRLIAATARHEGEPTFRAGIEVRLDPGWKTYWRYPGDSGVPPRFDFSGSENVKSIEIMWPAPHRFSDESGITIGYKDGVIFPLHIVPQDAAKPVRLRLKARRPVKLGLDLDYAVCEKLCMPVEASSELMLAGHEASHEAAVAAAEARVPQRRKLGEASALSILAVHRLAPDRVAVDVSAPEDTGVDLFAEGPTPEWALPLPEPSGAAPAGVKRFTFALDGLPPGAKAEGAILTLTAVAGEAAIEVTYRLD